MTNDEFIALIFGFLLGGLLALILFVMLGHAKSDITDGNMFIIEKSVYQCNEMQRLKTK